jgi:ABC-type phosphate/phosphonate transport system substrate-binding protein
MADAARVASLPMYDWPEIAWANDALWAAIVSRLKATGIAAPDKLDRWRPSDAIWRDPGLMLSHTCGYPFSTRLRAIVRLVGTPIYDVPGCDGALYSSMIVVRADEPGERLADVRGKRFAYNATDSLSGYLVLGEAAKVAGVDAGLREWIETGSHRASIRAVAEGKADVAAIDAVCWALALRHEPEASSRLKVIARTPFRPGLPFITAIERRDSEIHAIRAAVTGAIADPETLSACRALSLVGLGSFNEFDYGPIAALGRQFG